jgi:photosystem II stability/assembly factor-like uncharacterized protein
MSCLEDPQQPFNRPGLPTLAYRLGDYTSFRERLLNRLICRVDAPEQPQGISLQQLTTRDPEDPAIALLDACAVVADVLTFYQERIINEGYILTATERRSVLEMAREIGYELDPGVAASTLLAFTVDEAPNSPPVVTIPQGTQIMSVPGQDELPQTFETSAEFIARVDWNALKPRPNRPQTISSSTRKLYLEGINTQLQPGDSLLLMDGDGTDGNLYLLTLDKVQPIAAAGHTLITWNRLLPEDPQKPLEIKTPPRNPTILAFRQRANLFGHNAPRWSDLPNEAKIANGGKVKGGVYHYESATPTTQPKWTSINRGLTNVDVRCLVANSKGDLFAGTASGIFRGVFRPEDKDYIWTAVNSGLNNLNVQTILIAENDEILAGTAADGIFRSTDNGESWSSIGIGRIEVITTDNPSPPGGKTTVSKTSPNTVVRSLAIQQINVTQPTLASNGTSIEISPIDYYLNLRIGDEIKVNDQKKTITVIRATNTATNLTIDSAFNSNFPAGTPFVATRPNSPPNTSNITIVSGRYILASTDDGVHKSVDGGANWLRAIGTGLPTLTNAKNFLVAIGNLAFLMAGNAIYRSNNQGNTWDRIDPPGSNLIIHTLVASPETVFVGASNGIHRWDLTANNWEPLSNTSTGLSDSNVLAIAVNRSTVQNSTNRHIFALTQTGIFASVNNASSWIKVDNSRLNLDLITLTACITDTGTSEQIFAGALFTGFENSDWTDFEFTTSADDKDNFIDLDTLYPRILADTWIILKTGNTFQLRRIKNVSSTQRKGFSLDTKVTELTVEKKANPIASFQDVRETIVFAQSEILPLAQDPLNIPTQRSRIFFDPIVGDRVFLSQYIVGLQPQQRVIINGKRMRAQVDNIAGVARFLETDEQWERMNDGLTNTNTTCLAGTVNHNLFVGTAGAGVFRSINSGKIWKSVNKGLTNLNIQTLAHKDSLHFVGTAGGGIFRFNPDGDLWEEKNINLVHLDVRTLFVKSNGEILAGTIDGGVFRSDDDGDTWNQTALDNTDVQVLCSFIDSNLDREIILAGTIDKGVFRSIDGGITWQPFNTGLTARNIINVTALVAYSKNSAEEVVLAGTAGSGILRLTTTQEDGNQIYGWEQINLNPTDLNINCLTYNPNRKQILAGTVSGGVFGSIDDGDRWKPINQGLTCIDEQINPTQKVNVDIRSIAVINQQVFAAGVGILISPDGLYTAPIRSGDRLQVLAPPTPLGTDDPDAPNSIEQQWLLQDPNGFKGVLFTPPAAEIRLETAVKDDPIVSELAVILKPPLDLQEPVLQLVEPIQNIYDPETVQIYANVVAATHGEAITEVLGSGDGITANQKFVLNKPPVTHVAAPTVRGSANTLQVRVNDVLWQEVPTLYQRQPQEQIYITRIADDQTTTIIFGDGKSGNRLPSGRENIVANYRTGIGLAGQMAASQLTLLKTRPLGISRVTNPLPATGAAEPETMAEAQVSAPLTTRTLDRIVSLQDYEDFARAFVGIGKAQAIALWTGNIQQVHITIAAIGGKPVLPGTALYENLVAAIDNARDPLQQVQVDSYELLQFNLEAKLLIDPRYLAAKVLDRVETTLKTRFAFEQRNFGQAVTAAEAIATMQSIAGVIAVDLDALHRLDLPRSLAQLLPSQSARWDAATNQIRPAQLLLLNPARIRLSVEVNR